MKISAPTGALHLPNIKLFSRAFSHVRTHAYLFVVRVAGNFADTVGLRTLEYGYTNLNAKFIIVLGHEGCGAIKAPVDAIKSGTQLPPHLYALQSGIEPGITSIAKTGSYEDAVLANVRAQVLQLSNAGPVLAVPLREVTCALWGPNISSFVAK